MFKMDEMRKAEKWSTQEDMFCTIVMEQFGSAVESAFSKLLSVWTSGNAGYDYIEALIGAIINNGDITALSR